jgi:hypothetical protein
MPLEKKKAVRPVGNDSTVERTVRYKNALWIVIGRERASLARPAQYPLSRFAGAHILRLRNVESNEEIKVLVRPRGAVEDVALNMQGASRRRKRRSNE